MIREQRNKVGISGGIIFFLLIVLFLAVSQEKAEKKVNNSICTEVVADIAFYSTKATLAASIQVPAYHKNMVLFIDSNCLRMSSQHSSVQAFNKIVEQKRITLVRTLYLIKPLRFSDYFQQHIIPQNSDPLPILS